MRRSLRLCSLLLVLLALDPSAAGEGKPALTDACGDPLPAHALARFGTRRWRQRYSVKELIPSADGKFLVAGSYEEGVVVWDAARGTRLWKVPDHKEDSSRLFALSRNSRILATSAAPGRPILFYDLATGKRRGAFPKELDQMSSLFALSLDGRHMFTVHWRDWRSGKGEHLVRMWDADKGTEVRSFKRHDDWRLLTSAGTLLSGDGQTLFFGGEKRVRLWDMATGKEVRRLEGPAVTMALSADGRTLATRSAGIVRLWDVQTGRERRTILLDDEKLDTRFDVLAVSPEGRRVALAGHGYLFAWDTATGKQRLKRFSAQWITTAAFSADGRVLLWGTMYYPCIRLWDLEANREVTACPGHEDSVNALLFTGADTLLSGGGDGTVRCWHVPRGPGDSRSGEKRPPLRPGADIWLSSMAGQITVSSDGKRLAAAGPKHTVVLLEVESGKVVRSYPAAQRVDCVALSPDGKWLAGGGTSDGRSPNGEGSIQLWDVATGKLRRTLITPDTYLRTLVFSPDGNTLASGGDVVRLWNPATGKMTGRLEVDSSWNYAIAFSLDGKTVAASGQRTLLFDAVTKAGRGPMESTHGQVYGVAISPDGKLLATGSGDGVVRLWDVATRAQLAQLEGHVQSVNAVAFSPDGRALASGSTDTTILLWDVPAALRAYRERAKAIRRPPDLERLWADLARADAAAAHKALWTLVENPEVALVLIDKRLRPLTGKKLPDADGLLVPAGALLRGVRAVQVLEQIGTPPARRLLEALAATGPTRWARDARAALKRLAQRAGVPQ